MEGSCSACSMGSAVEGFTNEGPFATVTGALQSLMPHKKKEGFYDAAQVTTGVAQGYTCSSLPTQTCLYTAQGSMVCDPKK